MRLFLIVLAVNALLAAWVFWMAWGLWGWRCQLRALAQQLQMQTQEAALGQQAGYALMNRRAQIAETRLMVAQWQLRSRQAKQVMQLIQTLRRMLLYRNSLRPFSRKSRRNAR